jgi:Fe-S cluster assembly protein SufD
VLPLLRDQGPALSAFTADRASALGGPEWLRARRAEAAGRFEATPMPTAADELWRYTPVADLDLDRYTPGAAGQGAVTSAFADAVTDRSGLVRIADGRLVAVELSPEAQAAGVTVGPADEATTPLDPADPDALTALHEAFVPEVIVIRVPAGVVVDKPLVVVQAITTEGAAVFPHVVVETGESSEVTILDHWTSAADTTAFASPVVELRAGDNSTLRYVGVQDFGEQVWSTGYLLTRPGRDANAKVWLAALGGGYARLYVDARLDAQGANADIAAVYFGEDDQTHDFRSLQNHVGSRSVSNFLLKGAVVDQAHGIYTGLIRVLEGAKATESFLTNRNLVLNDGASVDSVPNLEIVNENDIRSCGHAAATGPVDEEHRFYLESRGVPTDVAERLIVFGFFDDVVSAMPIAGVREPLRQAVARKLAKAVTIGG